MRFLRHDGIYRSDVSLLLINPVQLPPPVGRLRYQAIGRAGRNYTSCPSSAMSSGWLFLNGVLASIARLRFTSIIRLNLLPWGMEIIIIERQTVS